MKNILTLLFIIIISPTVFAQPVQKIWSKKYLNQNTASSYFFTNKSIADKAGNLLVTAENGLELEILKLDTSGHLLWKFTHRHYTTLNKTIQFTNVYDNYEYNYIEVDANNNIYVAYTTEDSIRFGVSRWCIMKISPSGNLIWDKMYEGTYGAAAYPVALKVDANANVYATGTGSNPLDAYNNLMLTIKLNSSGVLQWEKMLDGNAIDGNFSSSANTGCDLALDDNANVYVTGDLSNYDTSQHHDLVLAKYSSAGNLLWSKVVNFGIEYARTQQGRRLYLNSNNEIIVCGYTSDTLYFSNTILLMKFDASGNEIWRKVFLKEFNGFVYGNALNDIAMDNAGNIIVATKTGNFGGIGLITKFSGATGDSLWTYRKDEYSNWQPSSVKTDANNVVYAWGMEDYYYQQLPYKRAWMIALDPSGNLVTSIVDTSSTYMFNNLVTRSVVRVDNSIFCFAHFNDDTPPLMNGLVVKFSTAGGNTTNLQENNPNLLNVYPSPFSNSVSINFETNDNKKIRVANVNGRTVFEADVETTNHALNTEHWSSGLYFLSVVNNHKNYTVKIFKQ